MVSLSQANQLLFLPCANAIHRMSPKLNSVDKANKLVAIATSLEGSKNKFQTDTAVALLTAQIWREDPSGRCCDNWSDKTIVKI